MTEMEQYYLNTLIFFLKTQAEIGFKGIERVLSIIDNERYTDNKKRELIIDTLRYFGLNEIAYNDGRFELGESLPLPETPSENTEDIIPIPHQKLYLKLLNGTLELDVPQN